MTREEDESSSVEGKAGEKQPPAHSLLRLIEEHANDLRKMLEKFRRRLH
jgi:hypothetical protein